MALTFEDFIQSPQFTFYVGEERKRIVVHAAAIAATSKKLDTLINGALVGAIRSASIENVRVDDFIRFCEYAYRGDYTVPPWEEVLPEPSSSAAGNQQNGLVDDWGLSFETKTTKKKKKAKKGQLVSDWVEAAATPDLIPEPEPVPAEEAPATEEAVDPPIEEAPATEEAVGPPIEEACPIEVQEYSEPVPEPAPEPEPEPVQEEPPVDPYVGLSKLQKKRKMAEARRKREEAEEKRMLEETEKEEAERRLKEEEEAALAAAEEAEWRRTEEEKAAAAEAELVSKIQYNVVPISRTPLRTQFDSRTYVRDGGPKAQILQHFEPKPNTAEDQNFTPVLLAHARLYAFAHVRLIAPLKALTLEKLHTTLVNFNLFTKRVGDIIELARFAYSNPDVPKRKDDGTIDDLRKLVVEYIVCVIDTIGKCDEFVKFMEEGGEFVGDFWRMTREYVV